MANNKSLDLHCIQSFNVDLTRFSTVRILNRIVGYIINKINMYKIFETDCTHHSLGRSNIGGITLDCTSHTTLTSGVDTGYQYSSEARQHRPFRIAVFTETPRAECGLPLLDVEETRLGRLHSSF